MEEQNEINGKDFVTCLGWIKIGIAKQEPIQVKYSKEELKEIIESTRRNLEDETVQLNGEDVEMMDEVSNDNHLSVNTDNNMNNEDQEIIDRYGLNDYDQSDDEQRNIIGGFSNLVQHDSNENDPYLEPDSEDEESEAEDFK